MTRSITIRLISTAAAVTAAVVGASAPAGAASGSSAPAGATIAITAAGDPCPELNDKADDAEGALVVLVDGSASSGGELDRAGSLADVINRTTADRTVSLSIGSFGGTDAEVRYDPCLDGDAFSPTGNNARTRERNREGLVDGLTDRLAALAGSYGSTDPTSALRAGFGRLSQSAVDGPRVLIIHTDGIPTAGCAALGDEVALDDPDLIGRLVADCTDRGQLPAADSASPIDVIIAGIGRTDETLGADAVTFLIELNTALCQATGATCRVDPNLPTDAWPVSG